MSVFLSSGSPTRSVDIRGAWPVDLVGDRLPSSASRAADVALVEEDAVHDALDRLVDRGVVEDDVRRLAAELQRDLLAGAGDRAGDGFADLGRAGEGDLVDAGMVHERRPVAPAPVTMLTTPGGRSACWKISRSEQQRGERRGLRRLEHDGVAAGQRGRDLPRRHQQREVPRDHLPGDAERFRVAHDRRTQLVGPAGVVEEVRGDQRDIDVAGLP